MIFSPTIRSRSNFAGFAGGAAQDFVKTSTGYGFVRQPAGGYNYRGATEHDVALMKEHAGPTMQVKAAGGVRTHADAVRMRELGATRIGARRGNAAHADRWRHFRRGARLLIHSSPTPNLEKTIVVGTMSSAERISEAARSIAAQWEKRHAWESFSDRAWGRCRADFGRSLHPLPRHPAFPAFNGARAQRAIALRRFVGRAGRRHGRTLSRI